MTVLLGLIIGAFVLASVGLCMTVASVLRGRTGQITITDETGRAVLDELRRRGHHVDVPVEDMTRAVFIAVCVSEPPGDDPA